MRLIHYHHEQMRNAITNDELQHIRHVLSVS
jgi:hypothetical protein